MVFGAWRRLRRLSHPWPWPCMRMPKRTACAAAVWLVPDTPGQRLAGEQGNHAGVAQRIMIRYLPVNLLQGNGCRGVRQAVKIRAKAAGESFQPVERLRLLEDLGIE